MIFLLFSMICHFIEPIFHASNLNDMLFFKVFNEFNYSFIQ